MGMNRVSAALKVSFPAAFAGWGAGLLYWIGYFLLPHGSLPGGGLMDAVELGLAFIAPVLAIIVLGVWFLVLLPLALLVPGRLFLWRPFYLTCASLLAGFLLAAAASVANACLQREDWPPGMYDFRGILRNDLLLLGPPAALVGAVTGLFGSFLRRWIRPA